MRTYQRVVTVLVLLVGLSAVAVVEATAGPLHMLLVVTVDQGPSAGLVVQGVVTAQVDPATGVLTGTLTPGVNPSTGVPYSTVLFTSAGASLHPISGVTEIQLRGQIQHHAVNLILLDVGGPGKHLYSVGTTANDTGKGLQHDPGALGGPAAGPEPGDLGDWEVPCCNLR